MESEKRTDTDKIANAFYEMMGKLMTGFFPVYDAIVTGLHGYDIDVSIRTGSETWVPTAHVVITYPDRKHGTQKFVYEFSSDGICEQVATKREVKQFQEKLNRILAEDHLIKNGNDDLEKMMKEWVEEGEP